MSKKAKRGESAEAGGPDETAPDSLSERIEAQREQIFKVMSIIEACRMGSESMIVTMQGDEEPDFKGALAAAYDLLNRVAAELENVGEGNPA